MALTGRTGKRIRDDGTPVFTKARADAPAHLFEREAAGLRALAAAGARVPRVLAWSETGLEIEWIDDGGRRTPQTEAAFGRELAGLHAGSHPEAGAPDRFGSPDDVAAGWLGACPVDYTPADTWAESWVGRRILPLARRAERAGVVPASARADAERLAELPTASARTPPPTIRARRCWGRPSRRRWCTGTCGPGTGSWTRTGGPGWSTPARTGATVRRTWR